MCLSLLLHIGTVPKQSKILCDLIQDLYLHQVIEGRTRKSNLLNLFFCIDLDTIVNHEIIDNVLFSDHAICIVNTLIATEPQKHMKKDKLYSTVIPEYDLMKAEESNWNALNSDLSSLFLD